jgi:hypothetical protein
LGGVTFGTFEEFMVYYIYEVLVNSTTLPMSLRSLAVGGVSLETFEDFNLSISDEAMTASATLSKVPPECLQWFRFSSFVVHYLERWQPTRPVIA